jgi:hypothetical protein
LQPKKSMKRKLRILDLINYGCKFRKKYWMYHEIKKNLK